MFAPRTEKGPQVDTLYLEEVLPQNEKEARKIATISANLVTLDNVFYFEEAGKRHEAVASHLQGQILEW